MLPTELIEAARMESNIPVFWNVILPLLRRR